MPSVRGCHLVGSVEGKTAEDVFRLCLSGMPGRLKRLPDGETGVRNYFVRFQYDAIPEFVRATFRVNQPPLSRDFTAEEVERGLRIIREADIQTGYDDAALDSYQTFKRLKEEGVIPADVKFQVCLPTFTSIVGVFVATPFQAAMEPAYEAALFKALRRIQDEIPPEQLAIQIDLAVEVFYFENVWQEPWYGDKGYVPTYISRMADQIDDGVDYGFHTCYGDMDHKHLLEPETLEPTKDFLNSILPRCRRPPQWLHIAVPLSAMDKLQDFYAPLKSLAPVLERDSIELFLGLVHYQDLEGTRERIAKAGQVVKSFGVATECGLGRTPCEQYEDIMSIVREVSEPVAAT